MFLEQLMDFLFWFVSWIITEISCPSRQSQERVINNQQQQEDRQEYCNPTGIAFDQVPNLVSQNHSFDYKEFPDVPDEVENESEGSVLLDNANFASDTFQNNYIVNTAVEFRTSWLLPDRSVRGPLLSSITRSFLAISTILISAICISLISCFFTYLDLETTDKCDGVETYLNISIPVNVLRWRLIGESFQVILINLWLVATIALLFGGKIFLKKFRSLFDIGLIMGLLVVVYKTYLFIYVGSEFKNSHYRYPANAISFLGVMLSCVQIARATKQSTKGVVLKIGHVFVFSLFMCFCYRYLLVPCFNKQTSEINKAMIAYILPVFALIPVAVSKYVLLCHCIDFIPPDASFVLIYFNYVIPISIYRIMQADLTDLRLFVAFSLLHGTINILGQISNHFREKVWGRAMIPFQRRGMRLVPYCSPRNRRLEADLEIQDMLSQFSTLILSQVYMILYRFSTFDVALSEELNSIYPRVGIGLAIEFVFAWLSIFIQIWLYNIAIKTVWFKYWLRHTLANGIIMVVAISYFSPVLTSVFKVRMLNSVDKSSLRNCTMPFTYAMR